jgi:hypothetical protein
MKRLDLRPKLTLNRFLASLLVSQGPLEAASFFLGNGVFGILQQSWLNQLKRPFLESGSQGSKRKGAKEQVIDGFSKAS